MATQQDSPQVPDVKFRVLIIGRANAGKTSILQRVCDTTESPEIYRLGPWGTRHKVTLGPTTERGQHDINDELIFTKHDGYIFHDSCGFEAGSKDELETVREFIKSKSGKKRLRARLHAIWYCIPMDNDRPSLDLKFFKEIRPDNNVPVIAVLTKYDQFKRNIKMRLQDEGRDPEIHLDAEVENIFKQHYLASLNGPPPFIRLENMHKNGQRCTGLIDMTADALSGGVVALMLVAVQRDNLELSIKQAIKRTGNGYTDSEAVIKTCIINFPSLWYSLRVEFDREELNDNYSELGFDGLDELFEESDDGKLLVDKLRSFNSDPPLCISSDDTHHAMIASILILDRASLFFASPSRPSVEGALDQAYYQYKYSDTHNAVKERFSLRPKQYSISQFTEFVLSHRL